MRWSCIRSFNSLPSVNKYLAVLLCFFIVESASSQIKINEICSSNGNVLEDLDGSTPDWIELHNPTISDVDLTGWFLSDDLDTPQRWSFSGTIVPANGYRLVFCSGTSQQLTEPHTNFKLSKSGETVVLSRPDGTLEDSVSCGFIPTDQSFGRQNDGELPFVYYTSPTPRLSNNGATGTASYRTSTPKFNVVGGYQKDAISVSITTETPNTWIHYSTDGSVPDQAYPQYTSAFNIDTNVVVRAVAYSNEFFPSSIGTVTYLFDEAPEIPTISIATDPGLLFHEDTGIYMLGPNADTVFPYTGANFWNEIEVPVHIQMIEDDGGLVIDQGIGLEIHGGSVSRTQPMRSFRLLAKSSYGTNRIRHKLFPSKDIGSHKRFLLRNSGSDFLKLGYRDGFIHEHLIAEKVDIDLGAYRPARVYINGQYWGMYNLREKVDRYYIEDNYNVDDKDIDLLEEQNEVIEGSFDSFNSMEAYVLANDLTQEAEMQVASGYFDIKNMTDYFACQTILNNSDWPWNNLKLWRERRDGAKWRYIMFDLDVVLGGVPFIPVDFSNLGRVLGEYGQGNRHVEILKKLLENDEFRRYFINRYNDLLNSVFLPESMTAAIEKTDELVAEELPKHWRRWGGNEDNYMWDFNETLEHINTRPEHARADLQNVFALGDGRTLSFNVFPEGSGTINLNSLNLKDFPWSGVYHEGNEVDVSAVANNGSTFSHWEYKGMEIDDDKAVSLRLNPENDVELVAVFDANFLGIGLTVYPEPATTSVFASLEVPSAGVMSISLVDMGGKEVARLYHGNTLPGPFSQNFQLPRLEQGIYLLQVKGEDFQTSVKLPIVQN